MRIFSFWCVYTSVIKMLDAFFFETFSSVKILTQPHLLCVHDDGICQRFKWTFSFLLFTPGQGLHFQITDGAKHGRVRWGHFTAEILIRRRGNVQRGPVGDHGNPEKHHRALQGQQSETEQRRRGGKNEQKCWNDLTAISLHLLFRISRIEFDFNLIMLFWFVCRTTSRPSATYWRRNIMTNGKRHSWYVLGGCEYEPGGRNKLWYLLIV